MKRILERLIEIVVGLLALIVAVAGAWCGFYVVAHPSPTQAQGLLLWAVLAVIALLTAASALYGLRLVVPAARPSGGQIVGQHGRMVFLVLYVAMLAISLSLGLERGWSIVGPVALAVMVFMDWWRRRGRHADETPAA